MAEATTTGSKNDDEEFVADEPQEEVVAVDEEDPISSKQVLATTAASSRRQNTKKSKTTTRSNSSSHHTIQFVDHFTLETPTSLVRFRGSNTHVHNLRNSQIQLEEQQQTTFLLEEDDDEQKEEEEEELDDDEENKNERRAGGAKATTTTTTVLIKNVKDENSFALNTLRATYTLECLFFYGILFCFCLLTIVFLLMDIVVFAGADDSRRPAGTNMLGLLGSIFALPIYVHGLASAMTIAGMYVTDTWKGHVFLRSMGQSRTNTHNLKLRDKNLYDRTSAIIWVEWVSFCLLVGIPVFVFMVALFSGTDTWWNIGLLTWFSCVTAYFCFFALAVTFYECQAAIFFLQQLAHKAGDHPDDNSMNWKCLLRHAILIRQKVQFAGVTEYARLTNNRLDDSSKEKQDEEDIENNDDPTTLLRHNRTSLYTRMTMLSCCGCIFEKVNQAAPGERLYSTAEILGTRQFATFSSWSLERIFCSNHRIQTVGVVRPPKVALTIRQMKSSLACSIMGILLLLLLFVSMVVWFAGVGAVVVVIIIFGCCCFPRVLFTARVYRMYRNVVKANRDDKHQNDEDDRGADEQGLEESAHGNGCIQEDKDVDGIYQTYEKYRVTKPKKSFCWLIFYLEIGLFFLWPCAALFAIRNYAVAVLFVIVGIFSLVRYYLNAAILVKELGSFDRVCPTPDKEDNKDDVDAEDGALGNESISDSQWNEKSRLSNILINVTRGPSRAIYIWIFGFFALVTLVYTVAAINTGPEEAVSSYDTLAVLPRGDFVYDEQPDLPYPTCRMKKGLNLSDEVGDGDGSASLLDYAYLSVWSYVSAELAQDYLDQWFGEGVAKNDMENILRFRSKVEGGQKAVGYRLVISTADPSFGVVAVRGSSTAWEFLTDAQLWLGSALMVVLRGFLPFGFAWSPILHQVLNAVSFIQSSSLERVALYKQTTSLVEALQSTGNYSTLHITGHSLGGGIAIITGAQTGIPAVGISGPNAMLSRDTFQPPLTTEALNTKVFNVMPNRDLIPKADDPGDLYQRIQCGAPAGNPFACHSSLRSLCEIMYQCGSHGRPGICDCATKYGFPEPRQIAGNRTFTEICGSERTRE